MTQKNNYIIGGSIGAFIGIICAIFMVFFGLGGKILYYLSLAFILSPFINSSEGGPWAFGIFYIIIVFTVYGLIAVFFINKIIK
ncbi:MAG: hypothetical protein KKE20_04175 [Nanoarchaeota archaeon]|nr:hypothetical protein [Nanoarchaeota archaeon]